MKKKYLPLFLLLFIFSSVFLFSVNNAHAIAITYTDSWGNSGYNLDSANESGVEITFSITEFFLEDREINGQVMQTLHLSGVFLPNDAGAPDLPCSGRYIAIPQGASASVQIIALRTETFQDIDMAPAYRIPLETETGPLEYSKNLEIYSKDAFYPENPVIISEPMQIRGIDAVILGITPFQYNPITKELVVYRDLKVDITFNGGNGHFGEDRLRSRWWDPILNDVLLNYASLPKMNYNYPSKSRDGFEYLIITPDDPDFIAWADSIKVFRTLQGILTGVVTTTEVGGNTTTAIENYINNAYNTWDPAPVAVLLLGDYGTTGSTIVSPIWYGGYSPCASDNIYADIDGDDLPEIAFARITAQDEDDLSTMIGKFLNYERTPPTNPDFYNHPIAAGGWQSDRWFILCSDIIYGFWENALDKSPVREYAGYSGGAPSYWSTNSNTSLIVNYFGPDGLGYIPATPSHLTDWGGNAYRINTDINSGAFIIQHRDHGGETGWGDPSYHNSDLAGLNNNDLTFVFSVNCLTGKYNWSSECFAEAFHRHEKGALGIIAASEVSFSFVNDTYVWGMYDNMWPDFDPGYGGNDFDTNFILPCFANASGKYYLQVSSWPSNPGSKNTVYHLFHHHGDAFTTVYSEVPQDLTVIHNPVLLSGVDFFTVTANEDALISLTVDGEIIGTGEGTGTPINITIPPQLPGNNMIVTITKQNYYRYSASVEIIPPSGPYVVYDSHIINDILGNNNGESDFGEEILLGMTLKNVGIQNAYDVVATISTADDYITITDSTENFGTILASRAKTRIDAFDFNIADDIPDQHIVMFDLEIAGSAKDTWEASFAIVVNAPYLTIGDLMIDDSGGNNNGRLDPGETVHLIIPTTNDGHSDSPNATGNLSCSNEYITINTGTSDLGVIPVDSTESAMFNITVASDTPIGITIPLDYNVIAGSYSASESFYEPVGLSIEDFETGDFSSYDWVQGGNANWTVVTEDPYEGTYCAKSGTISHNQTTELSINVDVFSGTISFYRKVSSEAGYDYLRFYIDGAQQGQWAGNVSWGEESYTVTSGNHTFKWSYEKDVGVSSGSDCAWIDFITFPPILPPEPVFYLNPTSIDFGEVTVGDSSTAQFTIHNLGGDTLSGTIRTPNGYTVAEAGTQSGAKNQMPYSIPLGQSQTYDLTFKPTASQSYNGSVLIIVYPNQREFLTLTGTGVQVSITELDVFENTELLGSYPNPAINSTIIKYQLKGSSKSQDATIKVYNVQGELVKIIQGKNGKAILDVSDIATGIYFYQLSAKGGSSSGGKTENYNKIKKMIVIR